MSHLTPLAILAGLLLVVSFIGSLGVWVWTFVVAPERRFLFAPRKAPLPSQQRLYLFFAGTLLIMSQVLISAALSSKSASNTTAESASEKNASDTAESNFDLHRVQFACGSAVMIACVGFLVVIAMPADERRLTGFRADQLGAQSLAGVTGFLAALLPVYLTILATLPLRSKETQHQLLQLLESNPGSDVVFWVGLDAILLAPLAEEMLYRVLLQGGLIQAGYKPGFVIPGVALFFAANHGFPDMVPLLPLALILGSVYHLRNSFLACVLIHMFFNAFNVVLQVLGQQLK